MNIRNTTLVATAIIVNKLNCQTSEYRGSLVRDTFSDERDDRRIQAILTLLSLFDAVACEAYQRKLADDGISRINFRHESHEELTRRELVATTIALSDHIRERGDARYPEKMLDLPALHLHESDFVKLDTIHPLYD